MRPFSEPARGRIDNGLSAGGITVVDVRLRLRGTPAAIMRVRIGGSPASGGGVLMHHSAVTFGPRSSPGLFRGRIGALRGTSLVAVVGSHGRALRLRADLVLAGSDVRGTVSGRPVGQVG
jgi:hypothetical protein